MPTPFADATGRRNLADRIDRLGRRTVADSERVMLHAQPPDLKYYR